MNSALLPKHAGFAFSLAVCASSFAADSTSPRLADSSKAQRDRDLTLISDGPSSTGDRVKVIVRTLASLREELRSILATLDRQTREAPKDDAVIERLSKLRDAQLRNIKKLEEFLARLSTEAETR